MRFLHHGNSAFYYFYHYGFLTGLRICGTFVADEVGRFQSPDIDADGYYENNVSCSWVIISPMPEKVVQIYITDMDIPSDDDCRKDRIEVRPAFLCISNKV